MAAKAEDGIPITSFVVERRNNALLVGDYGTYRRQLTRRLHVIRRKLGYTTPKGRKYTAKSAITAEKVASNAEFAQLLVLSAERAWAQAMHMKSMHTADSSQAIVGPTRSHIISRLTKAEGYARQLLDLLGDGNFDEQTALEASAYSQMLRGSRDFEAQKWEQCLRTYSQVYFIYNSLVNAQSGNSAEPFRDLLSSTVDPSIRYAAYQMKVPRTLSIQRIAERYVAKDSDEYQKLQRLDPSITGEGAQVPEDARTEIKDVPRTITWRSRTVNLEDAKIAQALALVSNATAKLKASLAGRTLSLKQMAAAYEEVLNPSQDAVDATKSAIDEMTADGVSPGDQRMQSLQITRTAVNYALVSWRVGRNRVLCGRDDGLHLEADEASKKRGRKTKDAAPKRADREEPVAKKLARLRERVVLYDTIIQSLDSVKELPGVPADQDLLDELHTRRSYFTALRCLSIARSYALQDNVKNALALYGRALILSIDTDAPSRTADPSQPLNIDVTTPQIQLLTKTLNGLVSQHRALVEIQNLRAEEIKAAEANKIGAAPLIERLDDYPANGVDLTNLVLYPPRLRPIPVKPIFLDTAWNYIDYPGRQHEEVPKASKSVEQQQQKAEEKKEQKKGWFSFGRS